MVISCARTGVPITDYGRNVGDIHSVRSIIGVYFGKYHDIQKDATANAMGKTN